MRAGRVSPECAWARDQSGGWAILSAMLLTTCPNCSAQFKVQPEQLNVRQGRVMCGRCRDVFNAFQSLTRIEEPEHGAQASTPAAREQEPGQHAQDTMQDVADPLFLREEPSALPAAFSAAGPADMPNPDRLPPGAIKLESVEDLEGTSSSTAMHTWSAAMHGGQLTQRATQAPGDNPLLASNGQRRITAPPRTRTWAAGSVLLALVLTLQATFVFRSAVAQAVPEARGVLVKACDFAGCNIAWGRDEAAIRIEASDLIETPGKTGRILLTATVANRGKFQQDFPSLELKLTDNGNQVLLSRILVPAEYLGRVPTRDEGLAANAELFVNLTVEIAGKLPASGYGVRAFYP